jgi:UDP-N-acetylglucosamine--N-acetylmuramyl-(pentapeptide) pyrophosphoryl-undecaprenol N-acetylglucosamine transferase
MTFRIIIAGGKTGGHLFPGIAVAQALEKQDPDTTLLFVGTNAHFEIQTLEKYGYAHTAILSRPVKGGSIFSKAFSMGLVGISLIQSIKIIQQFKPDFVLGVGGFSSFAVVLAAWLLKIPTAIQEQNAIPGMTNRWLSRFATLIFTAFKETRGLIHHPKVRHMGNPVRTTDFAGHAEKTELIHFHPDRFTILVTGGSQGASSINTAFTDALALMDSTEGLNIIHQTGIRDEAAIQAKYADLKICATVQAFFHNMPELLRMANLAITRAGAGTISELLMAGLPAILVPYPHAADDHQTYNAEALENQEAAIMIKDADLNGDSLKHAMEFLINNPEKLWQMSIIQKKLAVPDAADRIAACIRQTTEEKA